MVHDAKIEKPPVNKEGLSDPVNVFTDNQMVLTAWWNAGLKSWECIESDSFGLRKEWFGNVLKWSEIEYPRDWAYDSEIYGGGTE